jgi:hypothetical protein
MSRDIKPGVTAESKKELVRPFVLVKLAFDNGTSRVNSTNKSLTVDVDDDGPQEFLGIGEMGSISPITESADLQPTGYTMELTGIPITHISSALNEDYQGRPVKVWLGFFDDSYQIIADPVLMFSGFMNTMSITLGDTATVVLTAENELIRWEAPRVRRYTNEDQQGEFPGDLGLEFVSQTVEKELIWGQTGTR